MERKKILRFKSKILNTINLTSSVKHLTLSIPENFSFYPGQFISLILNKDDRQIKRPYSISSKPGLNSVDLCIKIVKNGLLTPIIDNLKKWEEVDVLGPMGDFIIKDLSKDLVFISTGTGIGPFRSMIYELLENNKNNFKNKVILLTGYRFKEDILYNNEFKELQNKYKNFSYYTVLSKTSSNEDAEKLKSLDNSYNGYVQGLVKKNLFPNTHYYICGLKEMVNSVKELLEQQGIPKENIFFERYD